MSIDIQTLAQLSRVVDKELGLFFPAERYKDLERAMGYVRQDFGFADNHSCVHWLLNQATATQRNEILTKYLTIGETYFFRDKKVFSGLNQELIPEILEKQKNRLQKTIHIWSAASSTGEEPYSIAMSLSQISPLLKECNIKIIATDINQDFINIAQKGRYSKWSFRDVGTNIKNSYFKKDGDDYILCPEIKKKVQFTKLNLAIDNFFLAGYNLESMDIIFCRNVLIYFDQHRRDTIISRLTQYLKKGGFLITSPSELGVVNHDELYINRLKHGLSIFQKSLPKTPEIIFPRKKNTTRKPKLTEPKVEEKYIPIPSTVHTVLASDIACKGYLEDFDNGNYTKIVEELGPIIRDKQKCGDLTETEALLLLGEAYANMGNYAEALKLGEELVNKDKINPAHHFFLATIFIELNQPLMASESLVRAIFLDHNFIMAYFTLATISPPEKAQKNLKAVISLLKETPGDQIIPFSDGMRGDHLLEITRAMTLNLAETY